MGQAWWDRPVPTAPEQARISAAKAPERLKGSRFASFAPLPVLLTAMPVPLTTSKAPDASIRAPMRRGKRILLLALLASPAVAHAEADQSRFGAAGYFRVATRPDFQGGDNRLGYWNLYGRLMNEGPWAALEMKLDLLKRE